MNYQVFAVYPKSPAKPFGSRRHFAEARRLAVLAAKLNPVARFKIRAARDRDEDPMQLPREIRR